MKGRDVPCACGDTLVSNVALDDDPVTRATCPGRRLGGAGERGNPGVGNRLARPHIARGRPRRGAVDPRRWCGRARVVSSIGPATLSGFRDGVVARGPRSLASLENVIVRDSGRDGVRVGAESFDLRNVAVFESARDGFSLGGHDFSVSGSQAVGNKRYGFFAMGKLGVFGAPDAGNSAQSNGKDGFFIGGEHHRSVQCTATGNGGDGFSLQGTGHDLLNCSAQDNGGSGFVGVGSGWRLTQNSAEANADDGVAVRGGGLQDEGGNRGSGNRGEQSKRPAVQCAISGRPCRS